MKLQRSQPTNLVNICVKYSRNNQLTKIYERWYGFEQLPHAKNNAIRASNNFEKVSAVSQHWLPQGNLLRRKLRKTCKLNVILNVPLWRYSGKCLKWICPKFVDPQTAWSWACRPKHRVSPILSPMTRPTPVSQPRVKENPLSNSSAKARMCLIVKTKALLKKCLAQRGRLQNRIK